VSVPIHPSPMIDAMIWSAVLTIMKVLDVSIIVQPVHG
jgi:hypothetical protein